MTLNGFPVPQYSSVTDFKGIYGWGGSLYDAVGLVVWKVYNVALHSLCSSFTGKVGLYHQGIYFCGRILQIIASSISIPFSQLSFCQIVPTELLTQDAYKRV